MTAKLSAASTISGTNMKMPIVGLGTWQSTEKEIDLALTTAIEAGYRHIDTALVYFNEEFIGQTLEKLIKKGVVKREELFIVTKLPSTGNRPEYVEKFIKKSLSALRLDYIDLYLIHNPVGLAPGDNLAPMDENNQVLLDMSTNLIELWKEMENQVDAGRAKAIGVSNFNTSQLRRIYESARIKPANNQVEMHIYVQQKVLKKYCDENNITICAYAPIGSPGLKTFSESYGINADGLDLQPMADPLVLELAKKYNKSTSQILLRFLIQTGVAVIPKSTNPDRIKANINIFDFEINQEDFTKLQALDLGKKGRIFEAVWISQCMTKHPEYPFNEL